MVRRRLVERLVDRITEYNGPRACLLTKHAGDSELKIPTFAWIVLLVDPRAAPASASCRILRHTAITNRC